MLIGLAGWKDSDGPRFADECGRCSYNVGWGMTGLVLASVHMAGVVRWLRLALPCPSMWLARAQEEQTFEENSVPWLSPVPSAGCGVHA